MLVELADGSFIDVASPAELRTILEETVSGYLRPPQWVRPEGGIKLNANGNSDAPGSRQNDVYQAPIGYRFRIHCAVVDLDIATPGAPLTVPGGYIEIQRNGFMVDFFLLTNGLPAVYHRSGGGPVFQNGERLSLYVAGAASLANASINVRCEGELSPAESIDPHIPLRQAASAPTPRAFWLPWLTRRRRLAEMLSGESEPAAVGPEGDGYPGE